MIEIEIRDLTVGSIVLIHGYYAFVTNPVPWRSMPPDGVATIGVRAKTDYDSERFFDVNTDYIDPMPITSEWLEKLGLKKGLLGEANWPDGSISVQYEHEAVPSLSLINNSKHQHWDFNWKSGTLLKVTSIHHLQALIWNLERVWLTLSPETP